MVRIEVVIVVKVIKLWEGTTAEDWFHESNMVDNAYKAYMKSIEGQEEWKEYKFEQWLYETYKVKWDTGKFYDKEELTFEDEKFMSIFLLKYSK